MGNLLFIPGLTDPVSEIRQLLFVQGQPGGSWIPTLSAAMIAANTFGSGVTDILDLSGNNNPFSQATSGSRGAWFREPKTGRTQLLQRTEELDNAYWTTAIAGTGLPAVVTPNFEMSPYGPATRLQLDLNGGTTSTDRSGINSQSLSLGFDQATYSRVYFKPLSAVSDTQILNSLFGGIAGGQPVGTPGSKVITDMGNGWKRLDEPFTTLATGGTYRFQIFGNIGPNTLDILVARPQAQLGSTATAYQRVTTAFDVTEQGQRDCYGVRSDSIDDRYATGNINLTGTQNVTVFAATRFLGNADLAEFMAHGSQILFRSRRNSSENRTLFSTGGTTTSATLGNLRTDPTTLITTAVGQIGGPLNQIRENGVVINTNTATMGTGNYANTTINLFGSSSPCAANLYALIVAGGSYPLSTIHRVERLLSRITPTVNL
jgi:hypothetical protein